MVKQTSIDKITSNTGFVNKINVGTFFDYFITYIIGIMLVGCCLVPAFQSGNAIGIILTICFAAFMGLNLLYMDAVVKVEIKNRYTFVQDFEHAFSLHFKPLELSGADFKRIRKTKSAGLISWGRIVHVIQHDNNLYFNVVFLGRDDTLSPIHGFYNYYKCRKVAKYFSLLQS